MNIAIFASIGCQNLGDELILKNEIFLLEEKYAEFYKVPKSDIHFTVFSYDVEHPFFEKENIEYKEYFPIGIKKLKNLKRNAMNFREFIRVVKRSDLIVVGGGGILYDKELQSVGSPLRQWELRAKIFQFFGKRVEFFRVGISIHNDKNKHILKSICSPATEISVRDNYSYKILNDLGLCEYMLLSQKKDPVFFDKKYSSGFSRGMSFYHQKEILTNSYKAYISSQNFQLKDFIKIIGVNDIDFLSKKVGIALRYLDIKEYKENVLEILEYILSKGATLIFVPHSFHKTDTIVNDFIFLLECRDLLLKHLGEKYQNKIHICKSMQESYEVYTQKKVHTMIAQRLHSMILSYVYEIDFMGVSYSKKTDELLMELGKD